MYSSSAMADLSFNHLITNDIPALPVIPEEFVDSLLAESRTQPHCTLCYALSTVNPLNTQYNFSQIITDNINDEV
jgi:hypothetical protein